MLHRRDNPYPRRINDRVVTDEMCECGHLLSDHGDTPVEYCHGACGDCGCMQFRWERFIELAIQ
jgi:hypothetical protein